MEAENAGPTSKHNSPFYMSEEERSLNSEQELEQDTVSDNLMESMFVSLSEEEKANHKFSFDEFKKQKEEKKRRI